MVREKEISKVEFRSTIKPRRRNWRVRPVVGLDTETEQGRAFLITIAGPGGGTAAERVRDWPGVIDLLHNRFMERSYNFFWNLEYDTFALLKHLPHEVLKRLAIADRAEFERTKIQYIPRKALKLKRGKHTVTFYDMAQFYGTIGLDDAAQKYLQERKLALPYNKATLSATRYDSDPHYRADLDRYAIWDAVLCQRLAAKRYKDTMEIMRPRAFSSSASFAQQFTLENLTRAMSLPSIAVLDFALKAYQGGRFETFKVGTFEDSVTGYDLNSAYPAIEAGLIACDAGKWDAVRAFDPEAHYGFYKIEAEVPKCRISPLRVQLKDGLMIYPTGRFSNIYVNQSELAQLREDGLRPEVVKGWTYHPKDYDLAFPWIKKLYKKRQEWAKSNPAMADVTKIILNGLYGKTIQMIPESPQILDHVPPEEMYKVVDFIEENMELRFVVRGNVKAGTLFNPIWASEITAGTRCQLYDAVKADPDRAIMFATDGILADSPIRGLRIGDGLGEWKREFSNATASVIGSGVYQIAGQRAKARGFQKALPLRNLLALQSLFGPGIKEPIMSVETTRTKKLKQTARSADPEAWAAFNVIAARQRQLSMNSDRKRVWERSFRSAWDVLSSQILSWPQAGDWLQEHIAQVGHYQAELALRQGLI